jgi:hypothetical protein
LAVRWPRCFCGPATPACNSITSGAGFRPARHRRRDRGRDSGRNRRQHGAVSQPQAPDQLGGGVPWQEPVGGQAKKCFHQTRQPVAARSPGAVRLGHRTATRLHLQKRFYRQMQHRGRKRALIAAARSLLAVVWQVLQRRTPYDEPANEIFQERERGKKIQHHLRRLQQLGVDISALELPPPTPSDRLRPLTGNPHPLGALGIHAR